MILGKNLFGIISVIAAIAVTLSYLWKMQQGKTRPHIFTWLIWTLTTGISAAARFTAHAGPGAWGGWASAASCFSVAIFALFKGNYNIKRSDIIALAAALFAIPAWILTRNPLIAVVMVTTIDVIGYYPTFRKSYADPNHEAVFNYTIANVIHILSLLATVSYSLTSVLFPATIFLVNTFLIFFVLWCRARLATTS